MRANKKVRLLIVQERIYHYRISFFNEIAQKENLDLTILHSGPSMAGQDVAFKERIVETTSFGILKYQHRVLKTVREFDVVIVMFDLTWISTLLLLLRPRKKVRLILWGIGFGRRGWVNRIRTKLMHRGQALLLYDASATVNFTSAGYPAGKIFIAHNTVHVTPSIDWRRKRDSFLFVGVFKARKRLEDLIAGFHRSLPELPASTRLLIVGSGDRAQEFEAMASNLGIQDRVEFLGKITENEKLESLFGRAIAYVSPGQVGLSVLQSFAHGVPVVTTENTFHGPEVNNIKDGHNSCFYDGSIEGLTNKLVFLANNPEEALRLGKNAYTHYSQHRTMDKMVRGFTDAIHHVLTK